MEQAYDDSPSATCAYTDLNTKPSHLGGSHGHVHLLSVEHERPDDPNGNRDVTAHDLAVGSEDALVVVALQHQPHPRTQAKKGNSFRYE